LNRKSIIDTLSKNGIYNKKFEDSEYFTSLPNYNFIIFPEGQMIDCNMHYGAFMAGCIPIIKKFL